ncbi:MAG: flippase [Sideroxydans sp.]|jgi:O-antigen/teichoic acid export membrane protein
MRARLLANLNWLFVDRVLRLVGGLLVGVWIARYLGPEQFGILNYALAFVALFGAVAKLGIDQVVIRDLTNTPEKQGAILGTIFALKLAAGLIALVLVFPAAWVAQGGDWSFMVLIAVVAAGMLFNALDAYDLYYQAHVLSRYVVYARSASFLMFSVVRVALILGEYPLVYFAAAATLEIALGSAVLVWLYRRKHVTEQRWYFHRQTMVSLLKDGWPLIVSSALIAIHTRIDQVMIGQMLGHAEVGIYSAAIRLSESWLFVPLIIVQTVTPYLMKLRESNPQYYRARLLQLYSLMFWLGALVAGATIVFGEFFVVLLFGEQYRAAYLPLVLTIWTGIFISQAVARGVWMVGENLQGFRLANNLVAVPMNIALNWVLIPAYGVIGASMASLVSIGFSTWLFPFLFKPMRESNKQMLLSINPKYLLLGAR